MPEGIWRRQRPKPCVEGLFGSSLDQIYSSRSAFSEDARFAIGTMLAVLTAGGVLLTTGLTNIKLETPLAASPTAAGCLFLASLVFLVTWVIRWALMRKLEAGYDLYVAAIVHATIVAVSLESPLTHRWMRFVIECCMARGRFTKRQKDHLSFDSYETFTPDRDGPHLADTHGKVALVWRSTKGNLYDVYRMLLTYICVIGTLASMCCAALCLWLMVAQLERGHAQCPAQTTPALDLPIGTTSAGGPEVSMCQRSRARV